MSTGHIQSKLFLQVFCKLVCKRNLFVEREFGSFQLGCKIGQLIKWTGLQHAISPKPAKKVFGSFNLPVKILKIEGF